jgi:uncharacterized membrane protein YdjX (TVP38/TMEM64 family)
VKKKKNASGEKRTHGQMILRAIPSLLILGLLLLALYLLARHLGLTDLSAEQIRAFVAGTGAFGALVFILASFLQVTFIPIPSTVTILAGALLFGPFWSFFYSLIGIFLGSAFAFLLGRVVGRPFVYWVAGDRSSVDYYLEKTNGREFVVFFFMFLLPAFPDDLLCAVAGITGLKPSQFAFIQLICRPIAIAATLVFMTGTLIPYHGWGLVVWGFIILASLTAFFLSFRYADRLTALFDRTFSRLVSRFQKKGSKGADTTDKE